jgi:hypothetical protein
MIQSRIWELNVQFDSFSRTYSQAKRVDEVAANTIYDDVNEQENSETITAHRLSYAYEIGEQELQEVIATSDEGINAALSEAGCQCEPIVLSR